MGDSMDVVRIFDTTLRDGEQSPGFSMNTEEKIRLARQLAALNVDVIEAGFPISSRGDLEAVQKVAKEVRTVPVAALARARREDVNAAIEALKPAAAPRLHIFLATSDLHLRVKLKMTREQALEAIGSMVRYGRQHVGEVEFSAEDAGRTDIDFLCQVCRVAVDAGATVLNLPDTVGYAVPEEYGAMFTKVREYLGDPEGITLSAHCHDDLGLAAANSLAAVRAGVRQIECTINGIGERAGNASLEEVVVALAVRKESFGVTTNVRLDQLFPASRLLTEITGAQVAPNKAVVGANAFAHEAVIHQDGIIKNPLTYEIISPQTVGVPNRSLVMGKHSGRNALRTTLKDLGYEPSNEELAEIYRRVTTLADQSKQVRARDIVGIAHEVIRWAPADHFVRNSHDVARAYLFGLVSQRGHPPVNLRQFFVTRLITQIFQSRAQCISARVFTHDQRPIRHAYRLRRNDFVGQRVLNDSILVNYCLMRKRVRAHHSFVRRHLCPCNLREQAARWEKLIQANVRRHPKTLFAHGQSHHHLFQRRVACPLANSVDRALDLPNAGANRSQRIRHGHSQVVVAMRA